MKIQTKAKRNVIVSGHAASDAEAAREAELVNECAELRVERDHAETARAALEMALVDQARAHEADRARLVSLYDSLCAQWTVRCRKANALMEVRACYYTWMGRK
jgi:hypothetical protein